MGRKETKEMKWLKALLELKQGNNCVKCPHCGKEMLDYGFIVLDKIHKRGYGAIWCNSCRYGKTVCRADLKDEIKLLDNLPEGIIHI